METTIRSTDDENWNLFENITVKTYYESNLIFCWTIKFIVDKVLLHDFMFSVKNDKTLIEKIKTSIGKRTLIGILSDATAELTTAGGPPKPRKVEVDIDAWEGVVVDPETKKIIRRGITSDDIMDVADKYIAKGYTATDFTPEEMIVFDSCIRKLRRTQLNLNPYTDGWEDLAEFGYYGLMLSRSNGVKRINDACC